MKRILVFLLILLSVFGVSCNGEPTNNGNDENNNSGNGSTTDDTDNYYHGYSYGDYAIIRFEIKNENADVPETLVVPEEFEGVPVKYFYVDSSCDSVKTVVLSKNIAHIIYPYGEGEPAILPNLERYEVSSENEVLCSVDGVIFSKDMKVIKRAPFSIGDYSIPSGVEQIGDDAFDRCSKMKKITIPSSVFYIEPFGSFGGCSSLTEFILESNEHFITENGMLLLKYPRWIDDVEELYLIAFPSAKGAITIPDSVVRIRGAFEGCKELTSVTIPESVEYIENNAFYRCSGLTSISLPQSLKGLSGSGSGNFFGCTSLTSIEIPASVSQIQANDFAGCSNLSINVADDNPYFSSQDGILFNKDKTELLSYPKAKNKYVIPETVSTIATWAFIYSKVEEIIIPDSVTTIGHGAFLECNNIRAITIPSSVTMIGPNAFYAGKDLDVSFEGTKEQWNSIEKGVYIFRNAEQVIHCSDGDITI